MLKGSFSKPWAGHYRSLVSLAALASMITACGGGGGSSVIPNGNASQFSATAPGAQPTVPGQSTAQDSPVPSPSPAAVTITGTVATADVKKFTVSTKTAGCSTVYVYYNGSTTAFYPYFGYPVTKGMPIQATGSGSCAAGIQATSVTYTAAATPPPQPTAAPTATPFATAPPTPAGTAPPAHIPTWVYDEYWAQGAKASSAQVRQYANYAQGGLGNTKAVADCSGSGICKSVFYFDPNMIYDSSSCATPTGELASLLSQDNESWYVHESGYSDLAHRVRGSYTKTCNGAGKTIPVYELDSLNPSVQAFFQSYMHANAGNFDDFFMDDTSGQVLTQFYGPGGGFCQHAVNHYCLSTQEMANDAAVVSGHGAIATALTHPDGSAMQGVYNGYNFTKGYANDIDVMQSSSHFIGGVCENCLVSGGALKPTMYASVLNAMAQTNAVPNESFVEYSSGASAPGSTAQIAQRLVTYAVAWLGFKDGQTIVWPDLESNGQNLEVFPEEAIYPTQALQTMTSGAANLQVVAGVYRREFANCYNASAAIGPCAAIVNSTGSTITVSSAWLQQTYGHTVQLMGGDIPSGGTMTLTGQTFSPNVTTIGPSQAILLVR